MEVYPEIDAKPPSSETPAMPSPLQLYTGYVDEDIDMLRSFVVQRAEQNPGFVVDGFSQRTELEAIPFGSAFNLDRLTLPVPDDGFHAEALEYVAVADAVRRAKGHFSAVEIGAGWGPWIALGGVLARARSIPRITLTGIEALPARFLLMKRHLAFNSLRPDVPENETDFGGVTCRLMQGAAATKRMKLWFPQVDVKDMGPAASKTNVPQDYRGSAVKNIPVEGYPLAEILGSDTIDYLHIDVQGTEAELVESSLDIIDKQILSMMIATHSRVIEGRLVKVLYQRGWYLYREKPCQVGWVANPPSIPAMTRVDGCQYWRRVGEGSPAFSNRHLSKRLSSLRKTMIKRIRGVA